VKRVIGKLLSSVRSIISERVKIEFSKPDKFGVRDNIQLKLIHNFYSLYHPIILDGTHKGDSKRNVLDRFELIQGNLTGTNCLDIGCGAGFFAFNIARSGHWVTGIDSDKIILKKGNLLKKKYNISNVEPRYFPIDEESVKKLPVFDNILYLSIHHHMIEVYGFKRATNILKVIATKTGQRLFFDFPYPEDIENNPQFSEIPSMGNNPDLWLENYLKEVGFEKVTRMDVFAHTQKPREKRPLFMAEH